MIRRHSVAFAAAAASMALLGHPAAPHAQQAFDGPWSVARVGVGCTPAGVISVRVQNGRFTGSYEGGTGTHRLTGAIGRDGAFSFTGQSPVDTVRFSGRIAGATGEGRWNVEGKACGGTLKIYR
jgi:hypothetical protein